MARIARADPTRDLAVTRELFLAYADALGVDLSFQGFADELDGLPGDYAPPQGTLLLAWDGAVPVGCVAVRLFEGDIAELKRLYVSPGARGLGLGSELTRAALAFAASAGYRRIRLDTLPSMGAAQRLYERLGFHEIAAYRHNPVPGARYMELDLTGMHGVSDERTERTQ